MIHASENEAFDDAEGAAIQALWDLVPKFSKHDALSRASVAAMRRRSRAGGDPVKKRRSKGGNAKAARCASRAP